MPTPKLYSTVNSAWAVAIAPYERNGATGAKGSALVLLRRTDEGAPLLEEHHRRCAADGNFYTLAHSEGVIGICKVLQGSISEGVALLEAAIVRQEGAGFQRAADLYRLQLSEIFVRIVSGVEMLPGFAEESACPSEGDGNRAFARSRP
jgi:hypothetical protein